ncbi:MAG TPA: DJ-1/PfpI family protein [Polyangiaceae bacterium]|jgi:cyclohexyl-isocyanide hydratase
MTTHIAMLLYPGVTQLDLTAPFELFQRMPDTKVHVVWKDTKPVFADSGLGILPTASFDDVPLADVLFVPGGYGQIDLIGDAEVLGFLRRQGERAKYVTSVCTGALLLGAAGLMRGYRAATHWAYMDLLPLVGATPVHERVVVDRNRITAGGVTAGLDFGLRIVAEIAGVEHAERVQLMIEYDPAPPFQSGHPRVASGAVVESVKRALAAVHERRREALQRASQK